MLVLPSMIMGILSAKEDKFGITEIYPTSSNGTEWYTLWDNGYSRELNYDQRDTYDSKNLLEMGHLR